jgi:WD40 repeat protein
MQHNDIVRGAELLPGGQQIMSWGADGAVRFWDAQTREAIGAALQHDALVLGARVSPDGKRVLSWSFDGTARQWDLATHQQIGPALKGEGVMLSAVWLRDGQRIATMSEDRTARLWDAATGQRLGADMKHDKPDILDLSVPQPLYYEILDYYDVAPSPDGNRLLTFANAFEAKLWEEDSGAPVGKPMTHDSLVNGAVFSHDGAMIATWSGQSIVARDDNSARLWSAVSTEPIGVKMTQPSAVRGAAFSADDTRLVTWTNDGEVQLWDTATAMAVGPVMKHERFVVGAAFSPDGRLVVSWGSDGLVKFWDAATGEQSGRSLPHSGSVQSAEFYADGRYLLTSDMTNSVRPQVRVWDVSLRREVMTLGIGAGLTLGAKWVEGDKLLTWGEGNAVQMWPADWFRPRDSLAALARDVCDRKLRATAVELDTVDGRMWIGARRITTADVDQSPVLSGREGEDVCAWQPAWYDRVLDAALGWMR